MNEWQPLAAGALVRDRYEVETLLGKGGFGATYRARDRHRFDQPCALKELLPAQATNPKVLELFEREGRTLQALRHSGIPALQAFFTMGGRYYLVQDFVAGETLGQMLERRGALPEAEVVPLLHQALEILQYLHGRSPVVIHRDIKPTNLILAEDGRLCLIDFGAVKEALGQAAGEAESTVIKSAGYTPPEQMRGVVVPASDLYALGATALHLVSGRHPHDWYNAIEGSWQFAGRLGVSAGLESLLGRLLEEQVGRRVASAGEAGTALTAAERAAAPGETRESGAVVASRFEILSLLQRDEAGASYRARDREGFGHDCVLFEFRPGPAGARRRAALEAEAQRLSAVRHPGVPRVVAAFTEGDSRFLVQELVEGESLAGRVARLGPMREIEVASALAAALAALDAVHAAHPGARHGAVEPGRIVTTSTGTISLADLRSAPAEGGGPYAPPAGVEGTASDLWAMGATGLYLATGRSPLELVGEGRLGAAVSEVGEELRPALTELLAATPDTARDTTRRVRAALIALSGRTQLVVPPPSPVPPPPPIPPAPIPPGPGPIPPAPVPSPVPGPIGGLLTRRNVIGAGVVAAVGAGIWIRSATKNGGGGNGTTDLRGPTASRVGFLGIVTGFDEVDVGQGKERRVTARLLMSGGPAEAAGVRKGDVILEAQGAALTQPGDLVRALASAGPGGAVRLLLWSGGQTRTAQVTLGNSPFPELVVSRLNEAPDGGGNAYPTPDASIVREVRPQLTSWHWAQSEYSYLVAWFLKGWSAETWPKQEPYQAVYVSGPSETRFEIGVTWSDEPLASPDDAFKALFLARLQNFGQGFRVLGAQAMEPLGKRIWAEQDKDGRRYLTQLTIQVSANSAVTFSGKPRSFVGWRRQRVPVDGQEVRSASILEAMRAASILRPTL